MKDTLPPSPTWRSATTNTPSISSCIIYKWKNHFSEMKGDVGMSHHEKEGNKKMPIPRQEIIDNPIPTSLFM